MIICLDIILNTDWFCYGFVFDGSSRCMFLFTQSTNYTCSDLQEPVKLQSKRLNRPLPVQYTRV